MDIKIAPSILSADFGRLNDEIAQIEPYSDVLHIDVMDGHFVPNITIGPVVVKAIKSSLPFDCHLMIENPQLYIKDFIDAAVFAGCELNDINITVHQEACTHLHRVVQQIKSFGVNAGVSINPATPVDTIKHVLSDIDMVLVMSVNPGFGGQSFIDESLVKIRALREMRSDLDIQVDGGINDKTAKLCIDVGANVLVSGSYIFKSKNRQKAIESLRFL